MANNPYADNFQSGGYFYNAIRQDIAIVKGDTCSFGFQIKGLGETRPDTIALYCKATIEADKILFSVSAVLRSYDSDNDILTYTIRIPPDKTNELDLGLYYYSLIAEVNGDRLTLLKGRILLDYPISSSAAPQPDYDNGDNIEYPLIGIPEGSLKIYTEQNISNIAAAINDVTGQDNTYTVAEMSAAVEEFKSFVPFTPQLTETILGQDGGEEVTGEVVLVDNWASYSLLKIIVKDTRDESREMIYYTTPTHLLNIRTVEGYIRLYLRHPDISSGFVMYSLNEPDSSHGTDYLYQRGTGNLFYISEVIGISGVNCTIVETNILISPALTNVEAVVDSLTNLYNYDLIFVTVNAGNYTYCAPCFSVISPYKETNPLKDHIEYNLDYVGDAKVITMSQYQMSAAKYLTVTAVKFVRND